MQSLKIWFIKITECGQLCKMGISDNYEA